MISLEVNLKDGKTPVKAIITEDNIDSAVQSYQQLTERFPTGGATTTTKKAAAAAETAPAGEAPPEGNVVNIDSAKPSAEKAPPEKPPAASGRNARRSFAQQAVNLNELALEWAKRMATAIPQFNGKSPTEIVEQLNFRKPLATMEVEQLQEVIKLIESTLWQYSAGNAGVKGYLKVLQAVDALQEGTEEEWNSVFPTITTNEDWAYLKQPGNSALLEYAKAYKASRQQLLQAATAAASCAS